MNRDRLNLCLSTLFPNPFQITSDEFDAGLAACADVGADGISLWSLHHLLLGDPVEKTAQRISQHGLDVACVEAIYGWANAESPSAAVADAEMSIQLCADFAAGTLAAVVLEPEVSDIGAASANLAAVADRAAEAGVTVCVEYLPWSGIPDIGTCWEVLRRSERTNVGILFDSWHWYHQPGGPAGANAETLTSIPGEFIPVLQLCDAHPEPTDDPLTECMNNRPLPGDGVVDHDALFALLNEIGADPIIAPEVFNAELVAKGPAEAATQIVAASRSTLERWQTPSR